MASRPSSWAWRTGINERFDGVDARFDRIENLLGKLVNHFGLDWEDYGRS